jgi:recombinational DNA repair protein RecR
LSGPQRQKQAALGISSCTTCDAYTSGDPCTICGHPKPKAKEEAS